MYNLDSITALVSTLGDVFVRYKGIRALISVPMRNQNTIDKFLSACR